MDNLPIAIKRKESLPGYVYLIKFHRAKNSYKIGSTSNLYSRLKTLGGTNGSIELIAYGYVHDKIWVERQIQTIFNDYSNNHKCFKMWPFVIDFTYAGDLSSVEYFIFDTPTICNVIMVFEMLCAGVQIGTNHPHYCEQAFPKPLGYMEEPLKFYDPGQRRYVPYPTEFRHGIPIYKPVEEWDDVPDVEVVNSPS